MALKPPPRVAGWTWFRPNNYPEKMVLMSDRGVLGLFGYRDALTAA